MNNDGPSHGSWNNYNNDDDVDDDDDDDTTSKIGWISLFAYLHNCTIFLSAHTLALIHNPHLDKDLKTAKQMINKVAFAVQQL